MSVDEKQTIWTLSNALSLARIALLIPASYFLVSNSAMGRFYALLLIALGALTDFFDGYFARKFSEITDFGRILDPLADKVALGVLALLLAWLKILPLWFVSCVLLRDILIFIGGMYIQQKKGIVVQSNWLGKWTAGILALLIAVAVLDFPELEATKTILLYGSLVMIILSFAAYAKRFGELVRY
ncbi:MAG: CDP-alcohol phosphatidyltransferase family protein [Bacteroidetes bacterium]|nr:MAG: CDP-alcohol phosphatidyltransferase family protein [Bacteroidota bacterium]